MSLPKKRTGLRGWWVDGVCGWGKGSLTGVPALSSVAGTTRSLQNLSSFSYFTTLSNCLLFLCYRFAVSKPCIASPQLPFVNYRLLGKSWDLQGVWRDNPESGERMCYSLERRECRKVHSVHWMQLSSWAQELWELISLKVLSSGW